MIRARDIRANLHQDMHTTIRQHLDGNSTEMLAMMTDALVDDAMFQIEHLLVEVEALHIEKKARDEKDSEVADGSLSEHHTPEVWHG